MCPDVYPILAKTEGRLKPRRRPLSGLPARREGPTTRDERPLAPAVAPSLRLDADGCGLRKPWLACRRGDCDVLDAGVAVACRCPLRWSGDRSVARSTW